MKIELIIMAILLPSILLGQIDPTSGVQKVIDKSIDNKTIFGVSLSVSKEGEIQSYASGNSSVGDSYFIASVTKLYTAAVIYKLVDQGEINLDDPISKYLDRTILDGLHVYEGKDYSQAITIRHLITNSSGIPDYFMQKDKGEKNLFEHLTTVGDTLFSFEQMLDRAKTLPAKFVPGSEGEAFYSDTNFQLLGRIITNVTGLDLDEVYRTFLFEPLNLKQTYLYTDTAETSPTYFYHKQNIMDIPDMMVSFGPDGGMVSTSEESLVFLQAYLNHKLFSKATISLDTDWKKIDSPFQYGNGIMKFSFIGLPDMIGHSGANGSFAYYIPSEDIYLTGTINQTDKPQLTYKMIGKILRALKSQ